MRLAHLRAAVLSAIAVAVTVPAAAMAGEGSFLGRLDETSTIASAVPPAGPAAGDVNPYGVAVVPRSAGDLRRGDILVSNFNNAQNQQGTGSSIVEISSSGRQHVFAVVPPPTPTPAVGLTTALSVLHSGFVIVGSLPAPQGDVTQATAGALTVLDSQGNVVETLRAPDINGPWDMTAVDFGRFAVLFVTNVLNQTVNAGGQVVNDGTVVRIVLDTDHGVPRVLDNQVIATGFGEHTDPSALVVGPTGVGLGRHDVLYVADSNGNRIAAVPHALIRRSVLGGGGVTVSQGGALNDPLGLAIAPNGDTVTANGGDGNMVETTPFGTQRTVSTVIPNGAGDLFGIAVAPEGDGLYFVDDAGTGPSANSLGLLH